jgi:hypothetical protein
MVAECGFDWSFLETPLRIGSQDKSGLAYATFLLWASLSSSAKG